MYKSLLKTALKYPDYDALTFYSKSYTYKWLIEEISKASQYFLKIGIKKDTKVIICLPNIPQAIICFYALNKIGAIPCMIHPLSTSHEIKTYISKTDSKFAITMDLFYKNFKPYIENKTIEKIVICKGADYLDIFKKSLYFIKKELVNGRIKYCKNIIPYKKIIKSNLSHDINNITTKKEDKLSVILFSGGTTSFPKAVMLSNKNFNFLASKILMQVIPVPGKDSMHCMLPLFHGFGLGICIHSVLLGGGRCILVPRFNKSDFVKSILKGRPSYIAGVPTLFNALINNKNILKSDLSFIKGFFVGGDSLSDKMHSDIQDFINLSCPNASIREGYGLTECVTACTIMPKNKYKKGSVGLPFEGIKMKIVKPNTTKALLNNSHGEICINGDTVMLGYLNHIKETKKVLKLHPDGKIWLHTGDMGYVDNEGFLFFVQRIKNIIKKSGYAIYPSEVEKALNSIKEIDYSCVVGIFDKYTKEKIRAYIVIKDGITPNNKLKSSIIKKLEDKIIKYSIPDEIVFKKSLPLTKTGKIDRKKIKNNLV